MVKSASENTTADFLVILLVVNYCTDFGIFVQLIHLETFVWNCSITVLFSLCEISHLLSWLALDLSQIHSNQE